MWRSLVSRLNGVQEAAGSNPVTRTTSEQAVYRLLRLFLKVSARSRRCSSFPTATRCAGLAVGRPPCGRHFSPLKCRFYPSLPKRLEIARFQAFFELSRQKWHSEAFQKRTRKRTDFKNRCAFFYQRARKRKWLSFRRRCARNFH